MSIQTPSLSDISDLLNAGSPLVLELALTQDGAVAGSTTVNAIGANADGSIVILDPNSSFGNTSLATYLNGFSAAGHTIQATVAAVIPRVPPPPPRPGFVVASPVVATAAAASSASGNCPSLDLADPATAGQPVPATCGRSSLHRLRRDVVFRQARLSGQLWQ